MVCALACEALVEDIFLWRVVSDFISLFFSQYNSDTYHIVELFRLEETPEIMKSNH